MTRYDAFGREIEEDPGAPRPSRARERAGVRRVLVLGLVVPIFTVAVLFVIGVADRVRDDAGVTLPEGAPRPTAPRPEGAPRPQGAPRPAAPASGPMFGREPFAAAVRDLRAKAGGRLRLLRVDAGSVIVQTLTGGGQVRLAQKRRGAPGQVLSRTDAGGVPQGSTYAWARVVPSAPARLLRAVPRMEYAVLVDAAGLRWSIFLRDGAGTYTARADGRGVRRIG